MLKERAMKVVTADDAVRLLQDGDTVLIGGSGGGHAVPEALIVAIERRFLAEGHPRGITSLHPVGLGDEATRGCRFAHAGLLKRIVCGTLRRFPGIERDWPLATRSRPTRCRRVRSRS